MAIDGSAPNHVTQESARPPLRDRGVLAGIVLVSVVGFIALAGLLRIEPAYAGLLFFWYWAGIRDAKFAEMPPALIGACLGICTAWLLQVATASHQNLAIAAVVILIMAAIIVQVMDVLPYAINLSFMLFLSVACAPVLQLSEHLPAMIESIVFAAIYFGAIVASLTLLAKRFERKPGTA